MFSQSRIINAVVLDALKSNNNFVVGLQSDGYETILFKLSMTINTSGLNFDTDLSYPDFDSRAQKG